MILVSPKYFILTTKFLNDLISIVISLYALVKSTVITLMPVPIIYTGWLKLKYPTGQNAISRQPCENSIPKFHDLYGRFTEI